MYRALATFVLIALASTPGDSSEPSPPFTVLEGRHAQALSRQCSRAGPPGFQDTWKPTEREIAELEQQLPLLQNLKSSLCCLKGESVKNVHDYYRQYVGIIVNGRKLIYINAFAIRMTRLGFEDWRQQPATACDGGEAFWGAIYDPGTKTFSQLAFNGVA